MMPVSMRTVLLLSSTLALALPASAQSNRAGGLPKLDVDGTFPSQRNKETLKALWQNEGKIIYLDGIDLEFENFPPISSVIKNCYRSENQPSLGGNLDGSFIAVPIPLKTHTTDEITSGSGSDYTNYDCEFYVSFTMLNKRKLPTSSAGTGILTILVRKPFLVSYQKSGYVSTFNLREVPMPRDSTTKQTQGDACKRFPNLC